MARIVVTEFMDAAALGLLRGRHDLLYDPRLVDEGRRLRFAAPSADALVVRNRTQVRGELLDALTRCKLIGCLGAGFDNIDLPGCARRGIEVLEASGADATSVAEYVIATAMRLLRGAYESSAAVVAGHWPRAALSSGREIGGKTLGLIGFAAAGRATAQLALGVGMRVLVADAQIDARDAAFARAGVREATLDGVVGAADVLSLHVPLAAVPRRLLDAARIAQMKPGAVLIDTALGGMIDEVALAAALKSGQLGGAAIDVFESEPLPAANAFAGCPNLLLTPHIAGTTLESNQRMSMQVAQRLIERLA